MLEQDKPWSKSALVGWFKKGSRAGEVFGVGVFPLGHYVRWYILPTVNMAARMHQMWWQWCCERALGLLKKRIYSTSCGVMSYEGLKSPASLGSGNIPHGSYHLRTVSLIIL